MSEQQLKVKTVNEVDMNKYYENEDTENPYYRKHGVKKKSCFSHVKSQVFELEEESVQCAVVTSTEDVGDARPQCARPSCDIEAFQQPQFPSPYNG